jgi:hypothetical protein
MLIAAAVEKAAVAMQDALPVIAMADSDGRRDQCTVLRTNDWGPIDEGLDTLRCLRHDVVLNRATQTIDDSAATAATRISVKNAMQGWSHTR